MPPPRPPIFAQPRCVPGVSTPPGGPRPALLLGLCWLAAANTRFATISVAPLLPLMVTDLRLPGVGMGLLFGLPVLLMGAAAIPGGALADRLGARETTALGLLLIAAGG